MAVHPEILWAQRSSEVDEEKNVIYLTVNLTEINEPTLKLDIQPKEITFEAKAGRPEEHEYQFSFKLYDEIDPEKTLKKLSTRSLQLVLRKKEKKLEYWPRLTEAKKLPYVKTDFSKWVDEDEQDGDAKVDEDFDMGGMGGMGDMSSMMGGMGGMGGLGGLGGGMDFEKMMADMKASGSDAGVDPADSDDDEDDNEAGPPPLEETGNEESHAEETHA